ncbi:MAG TPA: hypothetical protein VEU09_11475 [Candidatus Binatia bacterium]|nr:hypothetical protein [Candidatus Binatia bacterium]
MSFRSEAVLIGALALALLFPGTARADRRYFVETYTPYLAPAGETEVETWLTSRSGQQGTNGAVAWDWREELEYAFTDRFTAAAYLNFTRPAGGSLQFQSPSLELIYRLADPGRLPGDPAIYLETTESGEELELEPKLLLAHRAGRLVNAINLIGEFEFRHNNNETLGSGGILRKLWAWEMSGGTSYELTRHLAAGLEARYRSEYPNFGPRAAAALHLGPAINLQTGKVQIAVGVLRQVHGTPQTSGHLDLADFERTEVRAVIGVDL